MKKLKVFLADDSAIVRERFIEILSRIKNIEIVGQSGDGEKSLKLILKLHPDVALLDINMPGMNGIDVLTKIKAVYPDIKVILFTCYSMSDLKDECLKRGADFFFQSESINSLIDLLGSMKQIINGFQNESIIRKK